MKLNQTLALISLILLCRYAVADNFKFANTLFIADSHGYGNFGAEVDRYLRTISARTISVASCGSSPSNWVSTSSSLKETNCGFWRKDKNDNDGVRVKNHKQGSLEDEIAKSKPNLTVVALGTNILTSPQNIEKEKASIEKMIAQIKKAGSKCIWIGPPDMTRNPFKANLENGIKEIRTLVEKNNCRYVDSAAITKYPKSDKDGIHYGSTAATAWGADAAKKIAAVVQIPATVKASNGSATSLPKAKAQQ